MGKLSRTKGQTFEREIAIELRSVFPNARRQLEYHELDANGVDLQETGVYRIQCKRGRKAAPITKIKEIKSDPKTTVHALVTKGDNEPIYAVIPFSHFLDLIKVASIHAPEVIGAERNICKQTTEKLV